MKRMFLLLLLPAPLLAAEVGKSAYRGWPSLAMDNGLVQVQVTPDIGGRVIQFKLGDFEYLWVNDALAGQPPTASGLSTNGGWLNYGGDKLWPAPQGWEGESQWPGPPDAVLDGSPHEATVPAARGATVAVKLVSRKDARSGIQFSRVIRVADQAARVSFETTMTCIDTKPRRWGIWQVTQLNARKQGGAGFNPEMRFYSPLNPSSVNPRGYADMFGLVNNPSFRADPAKKMFVAHYEGLVGKAGLDNTAGWVATVDGTAGYVFVERFACFPGQEYPDHTSATVWLNGAGKFVCGTNIAEITEAEAEQARLLESEIISPYALLQPGESYTFRNDWFAARIGGNYPVRDCTAVGVTCEPLTAKSAGGLLRVAGRFGVFYTGTAEVRVGSTRIARLPASPREPLVVELAPPVPPESGAVSIVLLDEAGQQLGELARAAATP